ncbi:MAG: Fe-S cluster assembly protein SufB [Candidatus Micrarchaeia archaeon]
MEFDAAAREISKSGEEYRQKYGFRGDVDYFYVSKKGISEEIVEEISRQKSEPEWMLKKRLDAYKIFKDKPMPKWGIDLSGIDFSEIYYYLKPTEKKATDWDSLPKEIKETFDKLGIPEAERKFFAGTEAQFDSEAVYSSVKKTLDSQGVIFCDTDTALKKYPELVAKYFGTVVPASDNKFAALNTAVWSGGSFVYVPKGVKVTMPLQAYFRINAEKAGQFERTLIIAEEGSEITYEEGCTAPIYMSSSLHSAVVEIIAKKGAHVRYITVQNWSKNVYNLVTQRAFAEEDAHVEWIDVNLGSKGNMKYPSIFLRGNNAIGEITSVAVASKGQEQDTGGKVYHLASNTKSKLSSKSISSGDGKSTARFLIHMGAAAANATSSTRCDALLIDKDSKASTDPYFEIKRNDATITHEATIGKISEEAVEYMMSRGIDEEEAKTMIVLGFIKDLVQSLPVDYFLELRRLIKLNIGKSM